MIGAIVSSFVIPGSRLRLRLRFVTMPDELPENLFPVAHTEEQDNDRHEQRIGAKYRQG